ncbi:MAG: GNAT family N-acetyltransferase [Firmicutes bacterium]|nr:GNAT family N-acetyltransferase [Bacillota bacterium]
MEKTLQPSPERRKIRLIAPSPEMRPQIEEFIAEFRANGEEWIHGSRGITRYADFAEWLNVTKELSDGWLPSSTFFAVTLPGGGAAGKIVGVTDIRHYLTDETYRHGHIGYSVRPSERKKGYGTEMLRLALQKAYEFGILEAAVSCGKDNLASRKVIRRNGLQKKAEIAGENGNIIIVYTKELP